MTKYEWERQLKKGISGLPKEEQQRVLEYYNELFADKIDAGLREQYIISEFGNPYDVANKILVDYYNGDKENPEVDAYIYADSDDIDDAFDNEQPATSVVDTPKRKTWAERRDERKANRNDRSDSDDYAVDADTDSDEQAEQSNGKKKGKGSKSASGLIAILCVLAYFVLGACFNLWHPAWLIFLLIPCVVTLIEAINRRNWHIFAYPLFVTFIYLVLGFYAHAWHPAWVVFVTIPAYYVLGDFITKNADGNKKTENTKKSEKTKPSTKTPNDGEKRIDDEKTYEPKEVSAKAKKSGNRNGVVAIIAKVLMTICLVGVAIAVCWWVIGLFIGGIGMIIGGIGCIAGAFVGATVNWLLVGAGIAVLGLGLICAFGMAALFKPCFNMCKSFVKTIRDSFDGKEAA